MLLRVGDCASRSRTRQVFAEFVRSGRRLAQRVPRAVPASPAGEAWAELERLAFDHPRRARAYRVSDVRACGGEQRLLRVPVDGNLSPRESGALDQSHRPRSCGCTPPKESGLGRRHAGRRVDARPAPRCWRRAGASPRGRVPELLGSASGCCQSDGVGSLESGKTMKEAYGSGRPDALLRPAPVRTVRAGFPAHGSSKP